MAKQFFVNLPVNDLPKSIAFYTAMGAVQNPQFSDDTAACMVFSENFFVMLLTHAKWQTFTSKPISNAHETSGALYAMSLNSKADVDALVDNAPKNGGKADVNPVQDLGFMYSRSLADPDGHVWEPFFMDMAQVSSS